METDSKNEIMVEIIPNIEEARNELEIFCDTGNFYSLEKAYRIIMDMRLPLGRIVKQTRSE